MATLRPSYRNTSRGRAKKEIAVSQSGPLFERLVYYALATTAIVGICWIGFNSVRSKFVFASEVERRQVVESFGYNPSTRVILLVTSWCPACHALEEALQGSNVPFMRLDIEESETALALYEKAADLSGSRGIPLVIIDRKIASHSVNAIQQALIAKAS